MRKILAAFGLLLLSASGAWAANCNAYPYTFTNGVTADANQVNSNFASILNCANTSLAHNGANSDITSLSALSTPLSVGQGGTGAATLTGALVGNGTSPVTAQLPLSLAYGGTGGTDGPSALTSLGALPLAGGTMTGTLGISGAAGTNRMLQLQTSTSPRWSLYANSTAESGSNAGSNFAVTSYTDGGAILATPLTITRSTGVAAFSARPTFNGATPWDSANVTQSLGSSGWTRLPNGLLMEWGQGVTSNGSTPITFPTGFSSAVYNVQVTINGASGTSTQYALTVGSVNTSGFGVWGQVGTSLGFYWSAIGQ